MILLLLILFLSIQSSDTILINPVFTQQAYQPNGWYDNPKNIQINTNSSFTPRMIYSGTFIHSLVLGLFVTTVDDMYVDNNPELLQNYSKVILLHNEYVTKTEYDAIMNHTNVFYVNPNALYVYIELDKDNNTITKLANTENPMSYSITNTTNEFNSCGLHWKIVKYENGIGFNCYPNITDIMNPFLIHEILKS